MNAKKLGKKPGKKTKTNSAKPCDGRNAFPQPAVNANRTCVYEYRNFLQLLSVLLASHFS
jgi:hypothetical protein